MSVPGAQEVKEHEFYASIHWDQLMMHKAEFIPYLDSDEDTSYFDGRLQLRLHIRVLPELITFTFTV